ncbi:MAG: J domain-containing protein [Alphaproteobacteria bacterium]
MFQGKDRYTRLHAHATRAQADSSPESETRRCEFPGCTEDGDCLAPKSRDRLREYFHFCKEHAAAYNKGWNYFDGLSGGALEDEMRRAATWDRPTWPMGKNGPVDPDHIRRRAYKDFADGEGTAHTRTSAHEEQEKADKQRRREHLHSDEDASAEMEALSVLNLSLPVTRAEIRTRYRQLVKKYHPDSAGESDANNERIKTINRAYTVLKRAYANSE